MSNKFLYLKTMVKDYRLGAITRSSRFVIRKVVDNLPLKGNGRAPVVVEYGPGDGVITREALQGLAEHGQLIAIETNPEFVEMLGQIDDPRLAVRPMGVEDWLEQGEVGEVDAVFSGIPFTFFPPAKRDGVVRDTHALIKEGGVFVVYQNSLLMRPYLQKYFSKVTTTFEPRNFLPYFVMRAEK